MVVINIGMPRSGTLWRYNLIKTLVIAAGGVDALQLREQFRLQPFIGELNADMNTLKAKRLIPAMIPSLFGKSYALNSHARPFTLAKSLVLSGKLKAVYGYRDPRDCVLSMLEYSQRAKPQYRAGFLELKDVQDGIRFMQLYLQVWEDWINTENALILRYEDMHADFDRVFDQIVAYLEIQLENDRLSEIKKNFLPRQKPGSGEHIHLETGLPHRSRTAFSKMDLAQLNESFAPYLEKMGYALAAG
jgi:hypothetical protein